VCQTVDEDASGDPIKPFPDKPYLYHIVEEWKHNRFLAIEKSRQMLMSWLFCLLFAWDAAFHVGRRSVIQSETLGKAAILLDRAEFTLSNLPEWIRPKMRVMQKEGGTKMIRFPQMQSTIHAVARGGDVIRSMTVSGLLSDELGFQSFARDALKAARPAAGQYGRIAALSTPNAHNFFFDLVSDGHPDGMKQIPGRPGMSHLPGTKEIMQGLWARTNPNNGFRVLTVHYTADPLRRTQEWQDAARMGCVERMGSNSDYVWQTEQEINYSLRPGGRVFPEFTREKNVGRPEYIPNQPIIRGWDFGFHHPANVCFQFDHLGRVCVLRELIGQDVGIRTFAGQVLDTTEQAFPNALYYRDFGDPRGNDVSDQSERTKVEILRSMGVTCICPKAPTTRRIDLIRHLIVTGNLTVHEDCNLIIDAFLGQYVYPEDRTGQIVSEIPEKTAVYADLVDGFGYGLLGTIPTLKADTIRKPTKPLHDHWNLIHGDDQQQRNRYPGGLAFPDYGW